MTGRRPAPVPRQAPRRPLAEKNTIANTNPTQQDTAAAGPSKPRIAGARWAPATRSASIAPTENKEPSPAADVQRAVCMTRSPQWPSVDLAASSSTKRIHADQEAAITPAPAPAERPVSRLPKPIISEKRQIATLQPAPTPVHPVPRTPRKRAVPQDDVHCRNRVQAGQHDEMDGLATATGESPNKRSRSSKEDSDSSSRRRRMATDESLKNSESTTASVTGHLVEVTMHDQPQELVQASSNAQHGSRIHSQLARTLADVKQQEAARSPKTSQPAPVTTSRFLKQSGAKTHDGASREASKREADGEWRRKYAKSFPTFILYFDELSPSDLVEASTNAKRFGAIVAPFFSKDVTHLVSAHKHQSRRAPEPLRQALLKATPGGSVETRANHGAERSTRSAHRPGATKLARESRQQPLHSGSNPFEEATPAPPESSIVRKARDFNIRVWSHEKFCSIIAALDGAQVPAQAHDSDKRRRNLSQMLQQEKLQGTSERDPTAPRSDYHYFDKNSCYILVEDATCEHRVLFTQEFKRPRADEDPPWPKLYGQREGRCPFTRWESRPNARATANRHETLRRTRSMTDVARGAVSSRLKHGSHSPQPVPFNLEKARPEAASMRGASPYPMASGNSIALTSNIHSTTSAAAGTHTIGFAGQGALDRRLVTLTDRGLPSPLAGPAGSAVASALPRHMTFASHISPRGIMRRAVSTATGLAQRQALAAKDKEAPKSKPGNCENCRTKYDDFDEHVASNKHRRFALNDSNFVELDEFLAGVERQSALWCAEVMEEAERYREDTGEYTDELQEDVMDVGESFGTSWPAAEDDYMTDGTSGTNQYTNIMEDPSMDNTDNTSTSTHTSPDAQRSRVKLEPKISRDAGDRPTSQTGHADVHDSFGLHGTGVPSAPGPESKSHSRG
ncbi:hypothetical protein IE81DRAFT_122109 [Ceraceosorus guamensis]|uniref:DBF4-type domain-containing protein n=1 Tax=Ceraceosorus guamensis TaxID=1522189 RepID=A0A316VY90_9BASI|nr:hypothetical protein IE81DRAFT_122109 [Ceraceosorus guamensis]PWN42596.1 hypothetical protein IE81DRAFT_122109 [Ceraceosorus guamensis]